MTYLHTAYPESGNFSDILLQLFLPYCFYSQSRPWEIHRLEEGKKWHGVYSTVVAIKTIYKLFGNSLFQLVKIVVPIQSAD